MAKQAYYTRPLENLLRQASSITVTTGTALDDYGVANLYSGVWHKGLRIAGVSLDVDIEFASPVAPAFLVLGNTNLTVAAHVWGHTDSTFGGGSPDVDLAFAVPTVSPFGFFTSPYLAPDPAPAAKAHWRLRVESNVYPVVIGQFGMFATMRGLDRTYLLRSQYPALVGKTVEYETPANVTLSYEQATARESVEGLFLCDTLAERDAIREQVAAARFRARTFFLVPRASVNDAWLVKFSTDEFGEMPLGGNQYEIFAPVRMCARGLPHVDPDTL